MTYGVVICSKCKHVKGADLNFKTTKCLECNRVMKLDKTKVWARTEDTDELVILVGRVNAQMHDVEIEPPKQKGKRRRKKKKTLTHGSKREKAIIDIAVILSREKGTFTFPEFSKAVSKVVPGLKKEDKERFLEMLQARGIILEPRAGNYKTIIDE